MTGNFPILFVESQGLTNNKIYSEYFIIMILAGAILHMWNKREHMELYVLKLMSASIILTMCAEFIFTFYTDVYGILNLSGHIFKLLSYWFIYEAIIRTTLKDPYRLMNKQIIHQIQQKNILEEKWKFQANHDYLTGLYNRSLLEQLMTEEINRSNRYQHSFSVFMIDIDYFKDFNDSYGHQKGDEILINIASLLKNTLRESDYLFRYGGEEFMVILTETSLKKAEDLAERLRVKVANNTMSINENEKFNVTISIGITTFPEHSKSMQGLIEMSDKAMYVAKNSGRNCYQVYRES